MRDGVSEGFSPAGNGGLIWCGLGEPAERHAAVLFRAVAGCCESEQALASSPQEHSESEDGSFSVSQIHMQMEPPVAAIITVISVWSRAGSVIEATSGRTAQLAGVQPDQE